VHVTAGTTESSGAEGGFSRKERPIVKRKGGKKKSFAYFVLNGNVNPGTAKKDSASELVRQGAF